MGSYSLSEIKIFTKLDSPEKIQDFLESIKINFEEKGDTCYSPRMVIRNQKAHCMEGALFAAAALEFHGARPLVLDLRSIHKDFDHVVAPFRQFGCWGAISKTNHPVLRYREPVYKTSRELAMSYFHEYFMDNGKKTLREYSEPFDLKYFDKHPSLTPPIPPTLKLRRAGKGGENANSLPPVGRARACPGLDPGEGDNWRTSEKNLFAIPDYLDEIKHNKILSPLQIKNLRLANEIEIKAGKLVDWK